MFSGTLLLFQWSIRYCNLISASSAFSKISLTTALLSWYIMTFNYRATKNLGNFSPVHRKAMTTLDSIFKSRDVTLLTKVHLVKGMVFPVVMYRCESWIIKKAEHRRIDAFELWCWRRLLRVPLDCKQIQPVHSKGNQSWIFIGRTDAEAEAPVLWTPGVKNWLIRKENMLGKYGCWENIEGREEGDNRGRVGWMASPTWWT